MCNQRRLIPLTPMRNRSQEWSVGFNQNAIGRSKSSGLANRNRLGIGQVPRKRKVKAQIKRAPRLFNASRETVHDARKPRRPPMLRNKVEGVLPRIRSAELCLCLRSSKLRCPAMNDDGLPGLSGDIHLRSKGQLLRRNIRIFKVVIVKPDLTDCNASRFTSEPSHLSQSRFRRLGCLLRMDTNRSKYLWQISRVRAIGKVKRPMHSIRTVANTYGKDGPNTSRLGPAKNFIAVLRVKVKMSV